MRIIIFLAICSVISPSPRYKFSFYLCFSQNEPENSLSSAKAFIVTRYLSGFLIRAKISGEGEQDLAPLQGCTRLSCFLFFHSSGLANKGEGRGSQSVLVDLPSRSRCVKDRLEKDTKCKDLGTTQQLREILLFCPRDSSPVPDHDYS